MREKLIEIIGSTHYGTNQGTTIGKNFLRSFIEKIADCLISNGVTIPVRCKDCQSFEKKWSWENVNAGKEECCGYCYHWDYEQGMSPNQVDGDDFCSYGERRTDEQNTL